MLYCLKVVAFGGLWRFAGCGVSRVLLFEGCGVWWVVTFEGCGVCGGCGVYGFCCLKVVLSKNCVFGRCGV